MVTASVYMLGKKQCHCQLKDNLLFLFSFIIHFTHALITTRRMGESGGGNKTKKHSLPPASKLYGLDSSCVESTRCHTKRCSQFNTIRFESKDLEGKRKEEMSQAQN